jgi:hypothetical protein
VAPATGLPFASVGTDTGGKTKTLTIKNSSKNGELIGTVGTVPAPYSIAGDPGFNLAAGQIKTVTVKFAPTSAGAFPTTLAVQSNDPKKPLVNVKITGTGAAGKLVVPVKLAFLPTKVGSTSAAKKLVIKNNGLGTLIGKVGAATGPFAVISGAGPFSLNHLQSAVVMIQFTPTAKGPTPPSQLSITSDDPNRLSINVNLKGTGK